MVINDQPSHLVLKNLQILNTGKNKTLIFPFFSFVEN